MIWMLGLTAWADDTWFVPDRSHAKALEDALASQWPGSGAEVVVGRAPDDGTGARWDGLELVVVAEDQVRSAPAESAVDAVLLARTWALCADDSPVADLYFPEPLPGPPEANVVSASPPGPVRDFQVGVGLREDLLSANSGLRLVAGYTHGRNTFDLVGFVPVGSAWQVEHLALVDRIDGDVGTDRAAVALLVGQRWPMRRRGAYHLAVGPELGWTERWTERVRWRSTGRTEVAPAALISSGVSFDFGRFDLIIAQLARLSPARDDVFQLAHTVDLRFTLP